MNLAHGERVMDSGRLQVGDDTAVPSTLQSLRKQATPAVPTSGIFPPYLNMRLSRSPPSANSSMMNTLSPSWGYMYEGRVEEAPSADVPIMSRNFDTRPERPPCPLPVR